MQVPGKNACIENGSMNRGYRCIFCTVCQSLVLAVTFAHALALSLSISISVRLCYVEVSIFSICVSWLQHVIKITAKTVENILQPFSNCKTIIILLYDFIATSFSRLFLCTHIIARCHGTYIWGPVPAANPNRMKHKRNKFKSYVGQFWISILPANTYVCALVYMRCAHRF